MSVQLNGQGHADRTTSLALWEEGTGLKWTTEEAVVQGIREKPQAAISWQFDSVI